jgi:hypothetical protein
MTTMRLMTSAIVVACVATLCAGPAWAQTKAQPKQFGGLKLVDPQNPRGLETDISVRVDADRLILVDPVSRKEVKSLPYTSITKIDDTLSITPPLPAGTISGQSTGAASMPAYMGREARHWWTINAEGSPTIIRVSPKVYKQLRTAVAEHNVKIEDEAAKKKAK